MQGQRTYKTASLSLLAPTSNDVSMRSHLRELTHLNTPEHDQRKGYATKLLRNVCDEADRASIVLMLAPGNEDADRVRLANWYARFGFVLIQPDPPLMARPVQEPVRLRCTA